MNVDETADALGRALDEAATGLREALESAGKQQKYLVNHVRNTTPSMVSNWLSGHRQLNKGTRLPGVEDMRDVATALGVSGDRADRLLAIGGRIDELRGTLEKTGRGWRQNAAGRIAATASTEIPPAPTSAESPSRVPPEPESASSTSTVVAPDGSTPTPASAAAPVSGAAVSDFPEASGGSPSAAGAATASFAAAPASPDAPLPASPEPTTTATVGSTVDSPMPQPDPGTASAAPPSVAAPPNGTAVSVTASPSAAPARTAEMPPPAVGDAHAVAVDMREAGVAAEPERGHGGETGARRMVPLTHAALAAAVLAGLAFYGGTVFGGTDHRAGEGTERCGAWTHAGQGVQLQPCIKVSDETLMVRTRLRGPVGIKTDMAVQLYDPMTELPVSQQLKCHKMYITVPGQVQSCGYFAVRTLSGRDYAARSSWKIEDGPGFIGEVLSPTLRW
ncbi:hypothetical protein AB0B45_31345 [Nonomuraea sp. NPDC049152]|uniref:hypothetical protein n=1 Tax=Nonomuraea sp. NPDC049152 TaxID=3154350 RepID=UPI00340314A9